MINLGGLEGALGAARAVSADGSVITGQSDDANGLPQPFRWTEAEGMERLIALDGFAGFGSGLNPDGTVIVGSIRPAPYRYEDHRAFRWTEGEGLTLLGSVAGRPTHFASGVSADGSTIIGSSLNRAGYIWTPSSGARDLLSLMRNEFRLWDELEGWESLDPYAITPDGRFIVGTGTVENEYSGVGYIWTPSSGARDLLSLMRNEFRLWDELEGWESLSPYAITPDGRFIVGTGTVENEYGGAGWILDRGANPAPIPAVPEAVTYGLAATALLFGFVLHRRRARSLPRLRLGAAEKESGCGY